MKIRASLIELWKKITRLDTKDKVFWNGENNSYSEEMELVVSNSPTGSRAREMFTKFIYGQGLKEDLNTEFDDGVLLSEVAKEVIDDVVVQNGAFIHTTYGIELTENSEVFFTPKQPKSLNYHKCRISEEDDDENEGMILYKNYNRFDRTLTKREKDYKRKYYPFNPNQEVVKFQIKADAKEKGIDFDEENPNWSELIKHYRGQVMYLNLTPKFRYAISKFDSVYNDLDTEYRIGVYFNTSTRGGFLGKLAVITQGLDEEDEIDIDKDIANWLGAEGSSDIYHMRVEQAEDLEKVLKIVNVPSQFNDKQFSVVAPHIRRNILGAANNLPEGLAFADQNTLFGSSGESYKQMKQFYWEQCEWERQQVENAFWKLGFKGINFLPFKEEITDGNITE